MALSKKLSGKRKLKNGSQPGDHKLEIEYEQVARTISMHDIGVLQYTFETDTIVLSQVLSKIFSDCVPAGKISLKDFLACTLPENLDFFNELFSLPTNPDKKISGQFKLIQKVKDYRETHIFHAIATYNTNKHGVTVLTCLIRDISKESKQLRELQRNLEKSEKADEIKTNFLLNISHNIRTPMNSILGFSELLSLTDPGAERRKEYIQVIKRQSKSLLQLIDDVAEIAKYESGNLTITKGPVNINLLINEIIKDVEEMRSSIRKEHVNIIFQVPNKKGVEIFTDSGRLHQVFLNLVNYSLKYTMEGTIQIGYTINTESRIEFFIKDSSPGVSKEELRSMFEPFTLPEKTEWSKYDDESGLSLSIAKSIIKLLGGRISAESAPGQGVTFNFSLPAEGVPPTGMADIENEAISEQYRWTDKVILIVEDEDVNGLFLEAVFQETGAQTLYAKNGYQAVELCKSINKIDLILMDIKMPVMNGLKATQEIRAFNPSIPIIAQTALSMEEDRQNCLMVGCNDLITKPIEVEELLYLVNQYLPH